MRNEEIPENNGKIKALKTRHVLRVYTFQSAYGIQHGSFYILYIFHAISCKGLAFKVHWTN